MQDSSTILTLKQTQLELTRAKLEAVRKDGLRFYRPFTKQDQLHRSKARFRAAVTSNRWGKSTWGCAEDCAFARGERPWLPESDPDRRAGIPQHPTKGCIVVVDWDKAEEIWTGTDGKLWKFLPSDGFVKKVHRNSNGAVDRVECFNKSTIRVETVKSYKTNPLGVESSDWDWIHVDEPIPEKMFTSMFRGATDRGGRVWFTLTALQEPWITDGFEPGGMFYDKGELIEGSIYDNPYLTVANIKDFEATLPEDERLCRIQGIPLHKAGLIYKEFSQSKHVLQTLPAGWTSWVEPPRDWAYYLYIDPHAATPITVTFVAVDPAGRMFFYYDIFKKQLIGECCTQIKRVLDGRRIIRTRVDPCAYIKDPKDDSTWASEFERHGFPCVPASKDLERGILRTRAALQAEPQYIFFTPECRRTLWEITRYYWDPKTNKPVDVNDHAMENLRRAVLDDPRFVTFDMGPSIREENITSLPSLVMAPISLARDEERNANLIRLN